MSHKPIIGHFDTAHGSMRGYTIGFISSLALTVLAYYTVTSDVFSRNIAIACLVGLAIVQLFVQLVFFLHLGRESKPQWNLMAFLFMLMVLIIVVFGSLWIMSNLNYRHDDMGSPHDTSEYIIKDEGISQ